MKAISLWQPWASLMALGLKKIETRHWPTQYRGPLLIHAAKRTITKAEFKEMRYILDYNHPSHETGHYEMLYDLPYGALLCKVDLIDCMEIKSWNDQPKPGLEFHLGDYTLGRFKWITDNLKPLDKPIPYRGSQGFFNVPDDVLTTAP